MISLSSRVVDDVGELLGEQADVERVQHRAHRRHREVGLEVLLAVPAERADAIAVLDAERGERVGEPGRVRADLGEGRAARARLGPGDAFALGVHALAVAQDRRDREREILHRAGREGVGMIGQ